MFFNFFVVVEPVVFSKKLLEHQLSRIMRSLAWLNQKEPNLT